MAKRKEVVRLLHKAFGEVVIKSSFLTASSGSQFFTALCPDGKTRNLLAEPEYWKSDKAEVTKQFNAFSAKALALEKAKRAAERKKDVYAVSKTLSHDRRVRALSKIDAEVDNYVEEIGIDDAEQEHTSDEQAFAVGEF
jgi:hypothetical protein